MIQLLNKVAGILRIAGSPGGIRALAAWRPFSITSFHMARQMARQGLAFRTILDGGANIGQFARAMVETFPHARVISFEPLPEAAARLRNNLGRCDRWSMYECALGDTEGTIDFYKNDFSVASSILPIESQQVEAFPQTGHWAKIEVQLRTIDSVLAGVKLEPPILLKLDLQGYELIALKGARETLDRCQAVLLEAALTPFYRGEALFDEIHEFMASSGFRFLRPMDFLTGARGEVVQMDVLYWRVAGSDQSAPT